MSANQKLTSVKIDNEMWDTFKIECIRHKFSFQKLSERAIHMYLTDAEFKKEIHNHTDLGLDNK